MNEGIEQVRTGFYRWSNTVGTPGVWVGTGHGHLHVHGNEVVIFDPPELSTKQADQLDEIGEPVAVLLTSDWHDRAANQLSERYQMPVYALEETAPHCDCHVHETFADGDLLPGGWQAITIPIEGKTIFHGVTVFYSEQAGGIMVTGDAAIGGDDDTIYIHDEGHLAGLRRLLEYDFDIILTGHGSDILHDAKSRLVDAISAARVLD